MKSTVQKFPYLLLINTGYYVFSECLLYYEFSLGLQLQNSESEVPDLIS